MWKEIAMLTLRLPAEIEKRLEDLAARTGRTKSFYAREAILAHLDDFAEGCKHVLIVASLLAGNRVGCG